MVFLWGGGYDKRAAEGKVEGATGKAQMAPKILEKVPPEEKEKSCRALSGKRP